MAIQVRATQGSIASRVMAGLQTNLTRTGNLQERLAAGKLITRPSDSPTGAVSSMQLRGEIRVVEQYARNAADGLGWLGTVDSTLTSSLDQIRRARDLTLQGMSSGVGGSVEARAALAVEVSHLRESLISLANTRYLDRPVFGGVTNGSVAYGSDGVFQGVFDPLNPNTTVVRTVGEGASVRVDLAGTEVFGATGAADQLFTVLQNIADHLQNNPSALGTDLGNLDTAMSRVQTELSGVGARYNRVEQMRQMADGRVLTLRSQLSEIEDIDLPQTIMDVKLQEAAYQAALAAAARVIQPSLMEYLR